MHPDLDELVARGKKQIQLAFGGKQDPFATMMVELNRIRYNRTEGDVGPGTMMHKFEYGDLTLKWDTGVFSILIEHEGKGHILYGETPRGEPCLGDYVPDDSAMQYALSILRQKQILDDLAEV